MADYIWDPSNLVMGSTIKGNGSVQGLEYHRDGRFLVMTTSNGTITLIDSLSGLEKKKIYAKSTGVGKVQYTHHESSIICSSSEKRSPDIRYLCLHENRYLRLFTGHSDKINSLSMSPIDDNFLSSSNDRTVIQWDLSSPNPIAKLQLPSNTSNTYVSYDDSGVVFGVLCRNHSTNYYHIKLYDSRQYQQGPFMDIAPDKSLLSQTIQSLHTRPRGQSDSSLSTNERMRIKSLLSADWTEFLFSPCGSDQVLVNTTSDAILIFDGYHPTTPPQIISHNHYDSSLSLGLSVTPDSKHILAGTHDHKLNIYNLKSGMLEESYTGHSGPVMSVRANPKYDVLASACLDTILWTHAMDTEECDTKNIFACNNNIENNNNETNNKNSSSIKSTHPFQKSITGNNNNNNNNNRCDIYEDDMNAEKMTLMEEIEDEKDNERENEKEEKESVMDIERDDPNSSRGNRSHENMISIEDIIDRPLIPHNF